MTDPVERLKGREIVDVRSMSVDEIWQFGWDEYKGMEGDAVVIELDDGSLLVPSRDAELNGGGHLVHAINREIENGGMGDHNIETLDLHGIFFVRGSV